MNQLIKELNEIIDLIHREREENTSLFVSLQLAEAQLELLIQADALGSNLSQEDKNKMRRNTEDFIGIIREGLQANAEL